MLMDFHCIEAWLGLPEFRIIGQALGPHQLALHLERRDEHIKDFLVAEKEAGRLLSTVDDLTARSEDARHIRV